MKPKADAEKVEGIIIETCLRCGADLLASVIYTYPPINRMDCSSCGWHWESGTKPIERVLFGRKEAADGETD